MPDRSSHQGLPDEWSHGSHAAYGQYSAAGASDGKGAEAAGSHRAKIPDAFGAGPTDAYRVAGAAGAGKTDALGARTDSYGAGKTDALGARPAGTYGAGAADPFGDAAAAFATAPADARPDAERPVVAIGDLAPGEASNTRGFLSALFDFGFTSFVTPKVIKVLYLLIVIGTMVSALVFTIIVFRASVAFGVLTLVFADPLFILIVLAIYRIILEFFVVTFRVAEDIRALRERGDLG